MKSIKSIKCIILLIGLLLSSFSMAGKERDGGDAIYCGPSQENSFSGHNFLDYVLGKHLWADDLYNFENRNQIGIILDQIKGKMPKLYADLKFFNASFLGVRGMYRWMKTSEAGPYEVKDEHLFELLPLNCQKKKILNGTILHVPNIRQAIVRESVRLDFSRYDLFLYNPFMMKVFLEKKQASWVIIHEFAWTYGAENAQKIRDINNYLHSKTFFESDSGMEINQTLRLLGLGGVNSFDYDAPEAN